MHIHILGSSAGGGFPQWNCNCTNCDGYRYGTLRARRRTQSSITVSGDGKGWVLFNASPDILQQIHDFAALQPNRRLRDTAIRGIVLIDAQIDHTTGLYMLREHTEPLDIWCTEPVRDDLTHGNPIFRLLNHFCGVRWHPLPIDGTAFSVDGIEGLRFNALPLKSKAPPYSPHRENPHLGDNIGVTITDTRNGRSAFYAPGLAAIEPHVWNAMQAADCVLVDGTFWTDDEMIRVGAAPKRGLELGHLPQSGPGGMIEWLDRLPAATRKLLIHINNTNPVLDEDSAERAELAAHGIEVSHDGLELEL
ncbi:MAG: pyrroloquinoline quinone biosynthesis protein PqqB [Betaproteobacteria bacterium HGW-Betaproteobacteria-11]|nr:MAG: pyrroloquinoline quinone biosynthesis protein PqqB [Betaproteobacteria bacterium HGW-Betaproteobacteria-11]